MLDKLNFMQNNVKRSLPSKLFEYLDHGKKGRENFAMQILIDAGFVKELEACSVINDPPDFILFTPDKNKISCEVTEVHADKRRKGSPAQIKIKKYHKLLNELKIFLDKEGYGSLFGCFHLKYLENGNVAEGFLDGKNRNTFVKEVISIVKHCTNYNIKIYNSGFEENTLLKKYVDYFSISDLSDKTDERGFYWWFSHLQSGLNRTNKITLEHINKIITEKSKKLSRKISEKKYKENWLVIYSTDFGVEDTHLPPSIDKEKIDNKCFDKIFFVSSFFGPDVLYDKAKDGS